MVYTSVAAPKYESQLNETSYGLCKCKTNVSGCIEYFTLVFTSSRSSDGK